MVHARRACEGCAIDRTDIASWHAARHVLRVGAGAVSQGLVSIPVSVPSAEDERAALAAFCTLRQTPEDINYKLVWPADASCVKLVTQFHAFAPDVSNDREARARIPGRATVRSARLMHPYCRDGEHRVGVVTQQAHCAPTFVTCNPIAGLISTALVLPQGRRIARGYHGGSFERLPSQARGPRYLQSFSVLEGPSLGHLTDGQIPATVAVRALEGNEAALAWGEAPFTVPPSNPP